METINFKLHKSKIQPFLELFQSVKNCNPGRQKKPPAGGQLSSKAAPPPERQLLIVWETCSKFSGPFLNKAAPYRTVLKKKEKEKGKKCGITRTVIVWGCWACSVSRREALRCLLPGVWLAPWDDWLDEGATPLNRKSQV